MSYLNRAQRRAAMRSRVAPQDPQKRDIPIDCKIGSNATTGKVVIAFNKPVDNVSIPPAAAREWAKAFITLAGELEASAAIDAAAVPPPPGVVVEGLPQL